MNYEELSKKTVNDLREMAQEHEDIVGASGKTKEELIDIFCEKLGIEKPHTVVVGLDKGKVKAEIRALKKERDQALEAKDGTKLKRTRQKIHRLRHKLRRSLKVTT